MKRMFFAVLVGWCILLSGISSGATYGGGSGTACDPYQIWTPHQMNTIGANYPDWGKSFKLMADIDMSGYTGTQYNIIGNSTTPFKGTFDGNRHVIRNLTYTTTASIQYVGIFGYTSNATIENLDVDNFNIDINSSYSSVSVSVYMGIIAGFQNSGTIMNCYSTGKATSSVSSTSAVRLYAGGLVGACQGTINTCGYTGTINVINTALTPRIFAGGLAGGFTGTMDNCWSDVSIQAHATTPESSSDAYAGGVVAIIGDSSSIISNCRSKGTVLASTICRDNYSSLALAGGVIGDLHTGTLINCGSSATVTASAGSTAWSEAGGLAGQQWEGIIKNCFSTGAVNSSSVRGLSSSGGLVGFQYKGSITNSYSLGTAIANSSASRGISGGLVGWQYDTSAKIEKCYSTGQVSANGYSYTNQGGLVGFHVSGLDFTGTVKDCFWDTQNSGVTVSLGGSGVQGKTTAQMKMQSTFTGWDFANTWYMTGYPSLNWEINPLQAQIDAAANGATIVVQPGLYEGRLYFKGKNITLTSTNPQDAAIVSSTILRGRGVGPVVTFAGPETPDCVLDGFVIEGGDAPLPGGGGICNPSTTSTATVRNCIVQNNFATDYGGGIGGFKGTVSNCIIRNNTAKYGGGLSWCDGVIKNCLIVDNTASTAGNAVYRCNGQLINNTIVSHDNLNITQINSCAGSFLNCILYGQSNVFDTCTGPVAYSCYPSATGTGNIASDPMFISSAAGDYHLLPDSPCIDAGDPDSAYSNEPRPNGGRIDMGVYGNTSQAVRSRNGLIALGFAIINKTRVGRTAFEYELAVVVRNSNPYDMPNVQMQLKEWDAAVLAVADDFIAIDCIPAGATATSTDTFRLTLDRSQTIDGGRLTWELAWFDAATGQPQQSWMSLSLLAIEPKPGDLKIDGLVNIEDFAILAGQWQSAPGYPSADIAEPLDGFVDLEDLLVLVNNWMN